MRLRFSSVIYQSGSAAASLEQHYRELHGAMFPLGQHYTYLQSSAIWRPAMDIHETPKAVLVKIELAGLDEESIEITLYANAIVVLGQRIDDSDSDEETYYHEAQIRYGPFRADAYLATPVQAERASAVYHNGFLRITLPRRIEEIVSPDESDQSPERLDDDTKSEQESRALSTSQTPAGEPVAGGLKYSSSKEISYA
jgi:HSP20 family protein